MIFNFKGSQRLKLEIQSWVDENILSQTQAEQLYTKYDLKKEAPWYLRSGFILKGLALLLAGMGFLLLISENWHFFPLGIRAAMGLAPLLVTYGIGAWYWQKGQPEQTELAFFFAGILLGVNIFLQAQIFHISAYFPDGILWWIIGTLPVAIYFRSNLHHALVQLLYYIWISSQWDYSQFSYWAPVLLVGMLYLLAKKPGKTILLAVIVNIYMLAYNLNSVIAQNSYYQFGIVFITMTLLVITVIQLLKEHYDEKFISRLLRLGFWIILFIFYLHTFEDITNIYLGKSLSILSMIVFAGAAGIFAKSSKSMESIQALIITAFVIALHIGGTVYQGNKDLFGEVTFAITNMVFFAYALWIIWCGIQVRVKRFFMTGIFLIVLQALTRYLDLFEDYLLSSIIFIVSGIMIYVVHNYWDKRYAE